LRSDQRQATARLLLDQQCRVRADRPCRRRRARRLVGAVLYGGLCRDDAGRVPLRAVDARRRGPPGRDDRQPLRSRPNPPRIRRRTGLFHVQPRGHSASVRLLAQANGVPRGDRQRLRRACRRRHPRHGDRRLLLSEDRQGDVHGRARRALRSRPPAGAGRVDPARSLDRVSARLSVDRPPDEPHRPRRGKPVLTRICIVERTGSTNADLIADTNAIEGDWLVALDQHAGRGRQGRTWLSLPGNFYGTTIVQLRAGDPAPQTLSLAAGLALIEAADVAAPDQPLLLKWPNDLMLAGNKLAGILLERSRNRVAVGFGVNLAAAPQLPDREGASLGGMILPEAFAPLLAASFARL